MEADIAVINSYRLTDAALCRYIAAARGFTGVQGLYPDALFKRGQVGPTIDELAAILERNPTNRAALTNAEMTSREYIIFAITMLQAAVGAWVVEQHGWEGLGADPRENVLFYQRHKAQLDSLTAKLRPPEGDPP